MAGIEGRDRPARARRSPLPHEAAGDPPACHQGGAQCRPPAWDCAAHEGRGAADPLPDGAAQRRAPPGTEPWARPLTPGGAPVSAAGRRARAPAPRPSRQVEAFMPLEVGIALGKLFTRQQAKHIVALAKQSPDWDAATVLNREGKVLKPQVRSARVLTEKVLPEAFADFRERLQLALAGADWLPWRHLTMTPLQLVRYGVNDFYRLHRDDRPGGKRRLSIVCYLNDDFDGGETAFPKLDIRVQPHGGMAVLFDSSLLHGAERVSRGEKFVFVAWLATQPEEGP
ncbi:2OG-Fe(II) oxygenase [Corallococcus sp. AB018]|nr:2OG-Fe(II) oxygenase [Corallococcus sp. AB018]